MPLRSQLEVRLHCSRIRPWKHHCCGDLVLLRMPMIMVITTIGTIPMMRSGVNVTLLMTMMRVGVHVVGMIPVMVVTTMVVVIVPRGLGQHRQTAESGADVRRLCFPALL